PPRRRDRGGTEKREHPRPTQHVPAFRRSGHARRAIRSPPMVRQIAVIGTGTMGRGIAYLAALAGYETVIHDADAAALDAARAAIESTLRKSVEKEKLSEGDASAAMGRIHLSSDLEPACRGAELI